VIVLIVLVAFWLLRKANSKNTNKAYDSAPQENMYYSPASYPPAAEANHASYPPVVGANYPSYQSPPPQYANPQAARQTPVPQPVPSPSPQQMAQAPAQAPAVPAGEAAASSELNAQPTTQELPNPPHPHPVYEVGDTRRAELGTGGR